MFRTDFYLQNITDEVDLSLPNVLVLNRGAHYTTDKELLESLHQYTLPALQYWDSECYRTNQKCLLVWRTTVPGHPRCESFTKPTTSVTDMEHWIRNTSISTEDNNDGNYRKGEYHWQDFQHQNTLVTRMVLDSWSIKLPHCTIQIMDSYRPNILRPDHHRSHMRDCLHSCSPGGGNDLNSHWLYHILLVWSSSSSSSQHQQKS